MNDDDLQDWPRPHYTPGGAAPFLFYVVFGAAVEDLRLSRKKYRCDEIPPGLETLSYGPDSAEVVERFRNGLLWDALRESDPALAGEIANQRRCVIVRGILRDAPSLNDFRNTIGLLTCLLDHGGIGICDPQSLAWWSPREWRRKVFDPALPSPHEHVVILFSEEADGTRWFHTRGLRKFGRPDLSMHNVPHEHADSVVRMFNRFIEFQALGGLIAEGQAVHMPPLPDGISCAHGGSEDDPDFNNVHVELCWPTERSKGLAARATAEGQHGERP